MRTNWRTFPAAEVIVPDPPSPLDLAAIFGREVPLEIDLGCGDGHFLAALAREQPERDFLGVERMPGRVRASCRKIGDGGIANARVLRADILAALHELLPARCADVCHLLFSDPWPKRRHHSRRVFTIEFLEGVARTLKPDGELRVATDDADYFAAMQRTWPATKHYRAAPIDDASVAFATTFEKRFRDRGLAIHRLVLRLASD